MCNIITFYLKEAPNSDGRWLEEIWSWPDEDWELEHDFIQWLFPLDEPSMFNPDAPVLGADAIRAWHEDRLLQHNLRKSYERWLRYCGIKRADGNIRLVDRKPNVWGGFNHNWLRITRVLRCLTLLGMNDEAGEFIGFLTELRDTGTVAINDESFGYWQRAVVR